jgi:rhodanese-related sulfurtransferase
VIGSFQMSKPESKAFEELGPQQVADLLNARKILLVDVREPDEYAAQRIPGAVLFPLSTLDALALPPDGPRALVFQCGSGKRSALAAQARLAAGAPRAAHMTGGLGAWKAAGLPTLQLDPATGKLAST